MTEPNAESALPDVCINYSVGCDDCGLVGAGLNEEQAKALQQRHIARHAHPDGSEDA